MTLPLEARYYPQGFPSLGLSPLTLPLHYRRNASLELLAERVEDWEVDHGNDSFSLRNVERANPQLAFELANVYVSLRERFPSIMPGAVAFTSALTAKTALATAVPYASAFPYLRTVGIDDPSELFADPSAKASAYALLEPHERRRLHAELMLTAGVEDALTAGEIEVAADFSSLRKYRALIKFWELRNARAEQYGRPLRMPALDTSAATMVFTHEFGHLVDAEVIERDFDAATHLYASLSYCILGEWPTSTRQYQRHLVNYPVGPAVGNPGPYQGGPERRRETRAALRYTIGHALTRYAAASRCELFAEAFSLAFTGSAAHRAMLAPFRDAMRDVGVLRRRPNRTF